MIFAAVPSEQLLCALCSLRPKANRLEYMELPPFAALVKKHFHFLLADFGFTLAHESYAPETMGNAEVVFASTTVGISIVCDRNQVLIALGPLTQPRREWYEFAVVVRAFAPEVEVVYAFAAYGAEPQPPLEAQVLRLAHLLCQHCEPALRGDFSALA